MKISARIITVAFALIFMISAFAPLSAGASWHTIQTDEQTTEVNNPIFVWDGGGADIYASTKENWLGDIAPYTDGIVEFWGISVGNCRWDITDTMHKFEIASNYTGTIALYSDIHAESVYINGSLLTQASPYSFWIESSGYCKIAAGKTDAYKINLRLTGTSTTNLDIPYINRLRNIDISGTYTNYGYIYMFGVLRVNGTLNLNGHIFNYNGADIGIRGTGTVSSVSSYSYNLNSAGYGVVTPVFEPTITGLNIVFSNNAGIGGTTTFELAGGISVKSIATPSSATVPPVIIDMKGQFIISTNVYINKNATIKNTGSTNTLKFTTFVVNTDGAIDGTNIRAYINANGIMNVPSGTSFPIVYMTNPGATITNQVTVTGNYIMLELGATTYYEIWLNGLRWLAGTTDSIGRLYLTPGILPAGEYLRMIISPPSWYTIQSDSGEMPEFPTTGWHTIQTDNGPIYFAPYMFYTIQSDTSEYEVGVLTTADAMTNIVRGNAEVGIVEPGSDMETNLITIIWLLIMFIPAILLAMYLGNLGCGVGIIISSVLLSSQFGVVGIAVLITGIVTGVVIILKAEDD